MATHTDPAQKSGAAAKSVPPKDAKPVTKPAPEVVAKAAPKTPTTSETDPPPTKASPRPVPAAAQAKKTEKAGPAPAFRPPPPETATAGLQPVSAKAADSAPTTAKAPTATTAAAKPAPVESKSAAEAKPSPKAAEVPSSTDRAANSNAKSAPAVDPVEPKAELAAKHVSKEAEAQPAPAPKPVAAKLPTTAVGASESEVSASKALVAEPAAIAARTSATFGIGGSSTPLSEINETVLTFVRKEGEAAVAHFQALAKVTSPAELIRLQIGEFQRAADSSLSCIGSIVRSASRMGGVRLR